MCMRSSTCRTFGPYKVSYHAFYTRLINHSEKHTLRFTDSQSHRTDTTGLTASGLLRCHSSLERVGCNVPHYLFNIIQADTLDELTFRTICYFESPGVLIDILCLIDLENRLIIMYR